MTTTRKRRQQTTTDSTRYECGNDCCGATIPRGNVVITTDWQTGMRDVAALCTACRRAFTQTFRLVGNSWVQDGTVLVFTNGPLFDSLQKHVDRSNGVIQRKQFKAVAGQPDGCRHARRRAVV